MTFIGTVIGGLKEKLFYDNIAPSISVKSYNPWGGMTNEKMKLGISSTADAEKYLKYLDGTPYIHLPGLGLDFNDNRPNPFRIREVDGTLTLLDAPAHEKFHVLCQRNYCCCDRVRVSGKATNHTEMFSTYIRDPNMFKGHVSYSLKGNGSVVIAMYKQGGYWLVQPKEMRSKIKK